MFKDITLNRAIRRHHDSRLKRKRSRYWGGNANASKRRLGIVLHTPKVCSCWLCGNGRKHFGLTIQERRQPQSNLTFY